MPTLSTFPTVGRLQLAGDPKNFPTVGKMELVRASLNLPTVGRPHPDRSFFPSCPT